MGETVVIGTVFVDLKGFAKSAYDPLGRNLGEVRITHGGVGRNVAENFANVGMQVSFVGMLEDSAIGQDVERRLLESGVGLEHMIKVPENGIGMWLAILDDAGDLAGSISKMPDTSALEALLRQKGDEIVSAAEAVVLEVDLSESIAEMVIGLARRHGKSVYAIVGNLSVVLARKDLLRQSDCFICNEIEAAKFFGDDAVAGYSPSQMLAFLPVAASECGIPSMVITMGERGAAYYDGAEETAGICPSFPTEVVDTTGAGDAFFSGTVMGLIRGNSLPDAVRYGARLASKTIATDEASCPVDKEFFLG